VKPPALPPIGAASGAGIQVITPTAPVSFHLTIPAKPSASLAQRIAAYVSPSTASVGIAANGGASTFTNTTPGSGSCSAVVNGTYSCDVAGSAPIGTSVPIVVTLYSGSMGSGGVLGTSSLTMAVQEGKNNVGFLIVNGVLDHVALSLPTSAVNAGAATSVPLILTAYDASNNAIVGPGTYTDANGNAIVGPGTYTDANGNALSMTQSKPTVTSPYTAGTVTMTGGTTFTSAASPLTLSYDGRALISATVTATVTGGATVAPASTTLTMTPTIYEYAPAGSGPYSLAVGPDHQIWVSLSNTNLVEHFAPPSPGATSLSATTITIPGSAVLPLGLAPDENGLMWVTDWNNGLVYYCTILGSCTQLAGSFPHANYLVDGGDGEMYFDESYLDGPFQYSISTFALRQNFNTGANTGGGNRLRIGPDGRIWGAGGQAGCCNVPYLVALPTLTSANQSITDVAMGGSTWNAAPGPDGNIWYIQTATGLVGHLTSLTATSVSGPSVNPPSLPSNGTFGDIVAGPDGNMYFTEYVPGKIGRVTVSASTATALSTSDVTEYATSSGISNPHDIIAGPDGNVWFTEQTASLIGELAL
jgi:streptogramin lyase